MPDNRFAHGIDPVFLLLQTDQKPLYRQCYFPQDSLDVVRCCRASNISLSEGLGKLARLQSQSPQHNLLLLLVQYDLEISVRSSFRLYDCSHLVGCTFTVSAMKNMLSSVVESSKACGLLRTSSAPFIDKHLFTFTQGNCQPLLLSALKMQGT